jgi:hypothetical protein
MTTTYRLSVSASKLKDFDRCERAWYLSSVARAPDDANAGGQYLLQGDLFDEAVGRWSAKMDVGVEDLVYAVRQKPGLRGAALSTSDEEWAVLAERAQRMLRAVTHHLPPPKTAKVQHRYRLPVAGFDDRGGVVVSGATDLRLPSLVWDTKSTGDRGPGRGRDARSPAYALTDASTPGGNLRPLAEDVQALLYAWCEFQLNPDLLFCRCVWVYASKPSTGSPQGWAVKHVFARAETLAWFESYARPRIDRMLVLEADSEFELAPERAAANHDGCARCFRKLACNPFTGAQQPPQQGSIVMALDLNKLRRGSAAPVAPLATPSAEAAREDVYSALVAEAAAVATGLPSHADCARDGACPEHGRDRPGQAVAVAVNRPDAPVNPHSPVLAAVGASILALIDTTGAEADAEAGVVADPTPAPVAAAKGRGRPRRQRPATADAAPAAGGATPETPGAPAAAPGPLSTEQLEELATASQRAADAHDAFVAVVNRLLRGRGVAL